MKYQFTVDKIDTDTTHGKVLAQIRPGSTVLECGCASGYITKFLKENLDCKVHIIEYVQEAFDKAKEFAESGVCGDLMNDSWSDSFQGIGFDYILFMDVLEHLSCPEKVLTQAVSLLKEDGAIIITLPNIAHNDILINLYYNEFNYLPQGLLDNTHIKFFGKNNLKKFIDDAGLGMVRIDYTYVKTGRSEQFWEKECKASPELLEILGARQGGDIYQFVITTKKKEFIEKHNLDLTTVEATSAEYKDTVGIQDVYNNYMESQQLLETRNQDVAKLEGHVQQITRLYDESTGALRQSQENLNTFMGKYSEAAKGLAEISLKLQTADSKIKELETRCKELTWQSEEAISARQAAERMMQIVRQSYEPIETHYNKIIQSRGWRFLNLLYRIREVVLPFRSRRYKVFKAIFRPLLLLRRKIRNRRISKGTLPSPSVSAGTVSTPASVSEPVVSAGPGYQPMPVDEAFEVFKTCSRIDIMAVSHTAYIAELLQNILLDAGIESCIHLTEPEQYENIPYIMICPQNFKKFPPIYIAFQMEQTVSTRWLTDEYLQILRNAYAIFDYSLVNIKYFGNDPAIASKLYYMPIDTCKSMMQQSPDENEKEYDVLFYGAPFIERRQEFLKPISEKFDFRMIYDKFGTELYEEMKKAKIVVNVHYYQNALLETTRIYETLSESNCLVISERSTDPQEEERLESIVDFTEIGDVQGMLDRIAYWLEHDEERKKKVAQNRQELKSRANAAKFYLYRFLLANECITFDQFYNSVGNFIHFDGNRVCLSLPESIVRHEAFKADNQYGFEFFPGLKHRLGWIGCGMSYKFMFRKAMEQQLDQILICEDDVYFPPDFEERFNKVLNYVEKNNDWTVFSGIMADLGRVKPLKYVEEDGEEYIYLNKMISMVFNLYDKSIFEAISNWDNMNRDVQKNTIDRYLEDQEMRILTSCPFLVGHKEDLSSTIWGAQNTIYTELITNSSIKLREIVDKYKKSQE